nr:11-beta-hydroxysteroid dehydrogenase-like 2 [Quercus suber]
MKRILENGIGKCWINCWRLAFSRLYLSCFKHHAWVIHRLYIYIENVAGKVALITGASSGIGEHVAYEYARRGARLVLVARRVDRLQVVADKARQIGSLEVIVVAADVSKVEDCKRFVEEAVNHTLDNDINFWGSVYSTHYAIPYLRKSKGKIVVISSTAALLTSPRFSFYNASKAALISFFETLRTEFDPDIGITIVTPRLIESEMTKGEILSQYAWVQVEATEVCAKAIVDSACSGDMYLTEPPWVKVWCWIKILCLEVFEWGAQSISKYSENVAGKVILITGASSGIGEHVAYEYARRRACLALIARREDRLQEVANRARQLGSPEVIVVPADVSKVEDCKRFVDETVNHFGQLDHLVNNAGVARFKLFEDSIQFSDYASIMDINFWGSIYSTHNAVPHLRKRKGKIVVLASAAAWLPIPRLSFYNASKAALVSFFETLRVELGSHIGITIVTPGLIKSEMSAKSPTKLSKAKLATGIPAKSTEGCAKAIVASACRGDMYLTEPSWMKVMFWMKNMFPEVLEWYSHSTFVKRRQTSKDS